MKLYSLLVFDQKNQLIHSKHDLTDIPFYYRFMAKNTIENLAMESLSCIEKNNMYVISETVDDKQIIIYGYCYETNIIVITDPSYPLYLVRLLISNFKNNNNNLDELWLKYSDGRNADKIQQIKTELDETRVIILKSIDDLLERGEKITTLVEKTETLNQEAITFKTRAKQMNRCCTIV